MDKKRLRYLAPLIAATMVAATACDSGDGAGDDTGDSGEFPRNETLYIGGAAWGPPDNFNPNTPGEVTGLRGGIFETLFEFDPLSGQIQPWLAESGDWVEDDVYEVVLREGVTWQDGEELTSDDVVFTFNLRDKDGVEFGELNEWLDEVEAVDERTVRFTFSDPRYGQWDSVLYERMIVAEHAWSAVEGEIGTTDGLEQVKATGGTSPFKYHSHDDSRIRLERNDDWWAKDQLGLEMPMRYVVDFVNESNDVAVAQITQGDIDLSNFFLPNILELIEQYPEIQTYYSEPPYMLSQNTTSLIPNTTRAPLDDPEVRRAIAYSINVPEIIEFAYGGIVAAANPTGLLPMWDELGLIDQDVVDEHGFTYDPDEANRILDEAGYTRDGEFRTLPNGDPIELTLMVQAGWTDWEDSADIIGDSLREIGLNVTVESVQPADIEQLRREGNFDLVMWNRTGRVTNHLYTHYITLFQLPILDPQPHDENTQRYENERAWELTQELAGISLSDPASQDRLHEVLSELQEITLTDMPVIPMWHNGLWTQVNTTTWTNWPSDAPGTPDYYCATWAGVWQMGTVRCLAGLEPAGS